MKSHLEYLLTAYLFDNISEAGRREVEAHLEECPQCRSELETLRGTIGVLRDAINEKQAAEDSYFEEHRMRRVLEARQQKVIWRWMPKKPLVYSLAAVLVIALCLWVWSGIQSAGIKSDRDVASYTHEEKALDGDTSIVKAGADERGLTTIESEQIIDGKFVPPLYDPTKKRDMGGRQVRMKREEVDGLIKQLKPDTITADVPKGTTFDSFSNKDLGLATGKTLDALTDAESEKLAESVGARPAEKPAPPPVAAEDAPVREDVKRDISGVALHDGDRGRAGGASSRYDMLKKEPAAEMQLGEKLKELPVVSAAEKKLDAAHHTKSEHFAKELAEAEEDAVVDETTTINLFEQNTLSRRRDENGRKTATITAEGARGDQTRSATTDNRLYKAKAAKGVELRKSVTVSEEALLSWQDQTSAVPAAPAAKTPLTAGLTAGFALPSNPQNQQVPQGQHIMKRGEERFGLIDRKNMDDYEWGSKDSGKSRIDVRSQNGVESAYGAKLDFSGRYGGQKQQERAESGLFFTEPLLRNYAYYRVFDPALQLEQFTKRQLPVPPPSLDNEHLSREEFRGKFGSNPFMLTRDDRLSTFGMDVDTAPYTYTRNAIFSGTLPKPEFVRVEGFVNYFRQPCASNPDTPFSVFCEGGPSPFGRGLELVKITVKARELKQGERKNAVLTFAVDTSGSMADSVASNIPPSQRKFRGDHLELVRRSLAILVQSLSPDDRIGIVAYSTQPCLVLPHTACRNRDRILGAIDSLRAGGGTNVEAGLELAYRIADEVFDHRAMNRVILCSDGAANMGAQDPEAVLKKISIFADRGIYLTSVGFGMGRYDGLMLETLADNVNGNHAYVDSEREARKLFFEHLFSTLQVLAKDAKIQVDFNPEAVERYRLLGYEKRDIRDEDFRNDTIDAGEVGPGTTVTVLYEIKRTPHPKGDLGKIFIRFKNTGTGRVDELNYPLQPGVLTTDFQGTSDWFKFIACTAETAELLKGSYWARNGSFAGVASVLNTIHPQWRRNEAWGELFELVNRAQILTVKQLHEIANRK